VDNRLLRSEETSAVATVSAASSNLWMVKITIFTAVFLAFSCFLEKF